MKNFSIKAKLMVLLSLPLLALAYFSISLVMQDIQKNQEMSKFSIVIEDVAAMGSAMHGMQQARGMSVGFLASNGQKFNQKLPAKLKENDPIFKELIELLEQHSYSSSALQQSKQKLLNLFEELPTLRSDVLEQKISPNEAAKRFSAIIGEMLKFVDIANLESTDAEVSVALMGYFFNLEMKEYAGQERALFNKVFTNNRFESGDFEKAVRLDAIQQEMMNLFELYSGKEILKKFQEYCQTSICLTVDSYKADAFSKAATGQFDIDAGEWFELSTQRINFMREIELMQNSAVLSLVQQKLVAAQSALVVHLSILGVLTLLIIWLMITVVRSIVGPVQLLMNTMRNVEQTGQFDQPLAVSQTDEIGQMAVAFKNLLTNTNTALVEVNHVVTAIAQGDFKQRVNADLSGDLLTLKDGLNNSADAIQNTMQELTQVLQGLEQGKFDQQVNTQFPGDYHTLLNICDGVTTNLQAVVEDINLAMHKMNEGDFNGQVTVQANGALGVMKDNVNSSLNNMANVVNAISTVVAAQAAGDLTQELPQGQFKGQLHDLKNAINFSSAKIKEVVMVAVDAARVVSGAAAEVSQGSGDLSQRVQEQAAALEQTSATMNQMSSQVQSSSENAQQANQVAETVQVKAQQGVNVMQDTIEAMKAIEESSDKISDIVNLIDGIAFQTNLLALNAAVEAARAGDHGRGFAVVAGEVRSLAQKAADAAKDIKKLIDETVDRVNQGSSLAEESGEMLKEIAQSIDSVSQMVHEIATASIEQAEGVKQVNQAITQIDGVTQQNAALVEETSAASESLSDQANILSKEMAFFKTGANSQATARAPAKATIGSSAKPALSKPTSSASPQKALAKPSNAAHSDDEWGEF